MTRKMKDNSPKTYVVLGMHQSGTSFLSKALNDAGVNMYISNPYVDESQAFVRMNTTLLNYGGGTWLKPPSEQLLKAAAVHYRPTIKNLIDNHKADMWGFKDPRTSLTIDAYYPHLEDDFYMIAIFRRPEKVGASLALRDNIPAKQGENLARAYNRRILTFLEEKYT